MAENDDPQIFKKRYKVDRKLGAGNFGTAYLVTDLKAKNEPKVLKVVRLGEMDDEQTVDSVREAELLANLDNEYIVKFYESFLENDCLCIVTEYCEGGDLDQRLKELKKQNRSLEEDQVVEWLIEILIAVQYMHKSRILHRDLKARNIFLKSNQIKIGDFGISRILIGTMDVATTFTGTPYYMSPEVMKHDGYESKSDIWSVGCLLYEMCTFQHAYDGKGLMNVIYKIVEGKPPELPKTYSKELNDLLKKIFTKDPKNRPTATQLLQTPFILRHRERTKLNGPLENTIAGKQRSREINTRLQNPMNYGQMQSQSWSISSKDFMTYNDDDDDNNNTIQSNHNTINTVNEEDEDEDEEEQPTLKPAHTMKSSKQPIVERKSHEPNTRGQYNNQPIRSSFDNPNEKGQVSKINNRPSAMNAPGRDRFDDRPITPMRGTYRQVAEKYGDDEYDRGSTREKDSFKNTRTMSASQRSTINSMSRTFDPRYAAKHNEQQVKPMTPSRTIGSATRRNNTSNDDYSATLRDNPRQDAFGPLAKDMKINTLRTKAIQALGESTFEKVYDYLVKQRTAQKTNPDLDDAKIAQGLTAFVKKPGDCFLVDQLVFLELI